MLLIDQDRPLRAIAERAQMFQPVAVEKNIGVVAHAYGLWNIPEIFWLAGKYSNVIAAGFEFAE